MWKKSLKIGKTLYPCFFIILWSIVCIIAWLNPAQEISDAERRKLAQFPTLSVKTVLSREFMTGFSDYAVDQFPFRDKFRSIKSVSAYHVMQQSDNNGLYVNSGSIAKMEYPLNQHSIDHAVKVFNDVYNQYIKGHENKCYFTIVPDKNYYMASKTGHLEIDYAKLHAKIQNKLPWAEPVVINDQLNEKSYYNTDPHWRQDAILSVADTIIKAMNKQTTVQNYQNPSAFDREVVCDSFKGTYASQSALPAKPEDIVVLHNRYIDNATVFDYEANKEFPVYADITEAKDKYDAYLHGAKALLKIENKEATTDKELIVFRDSFGSSLIPLMIGEYKTITVVDLRYIKAKMLKEFIEFNDQDVLFLYSTTVLNNSSTIG